MWGGIPRYWELAADYPDREAAIQGLVLRDLAQAASILTLIGQGCHRPSEIASRLGKPATSLSRPLNGCWSWAWSGGISRSGPRRGTVSGRAIGSRIPSSGSGSDFQRLRAELQQKIGRLPLAHGREVLAGIWTPVGAGRGGRFGPRDILRALR